MLGKNVLVPIADGVEELEAVTIIDVLRRASIGVRVSSIEEREISGANNIKIVADSDFMDECIEDYDAIILPGGTSGAEHLVAHIKVVEAIKSFHWQGKIIAAICASPAIVLSSIGLLDDKRATCYPSFKERLKNYVDDKVVVDNNIVTSQGPGTAFAFAHKLVEILADEKTASSVKAGMLFDR